MRKMIVIGMFMIASTYSRSVSWTTNSRTRLKIDRIDSRPMKIS